MKTNTTDNQYLTIAETDLLLYLQKNGIQNQRILSEETGYSLGMINKLLHGIQDKGYLDPEYRLTTKAIQELTRNKPHNAVILAAGFGMRMVPINLSAPKAFLEVKGERLIERLINQLHEAGIRKITVVAGFMKEEFEYLIDEFDVNLVINEAYASKNNLYSLAEASEELGNTYIVPCDLWCRNNPFSAYELYSWYAVSEEKTTDSDLRLNRKRELVRTEDEQGNRMIGICYLA
ncbi:MAG: NTP transferase domain-containing protein, partial [Solobacterium sp.]|nr:NTP transferase domain-containing protein [Solobacterium sp.]